MKAIINIQPSLSSPDYYFIPDGERSSSYIKKTSCMVIDDKSKQEAIEALDRLMDDEYGWDQDDFKTIRNYIEGKE